MAAEHGISFWIEKDGRVCLFDTGQGPAFAGNSELLGLPLEKAQAAAFSHGHYDHTGGLAHLLERSPGARIFLHPECLRERYSRHANGTVHSIGMRPEIRSALQKHKASVVWTESPSEIMPGVWVTGAIPRKTEEDAGGDFFLEPDCLTPDHVPDDQALWIQTRGGIVVLLGCGHSGAVNTLDYISSLTGEKTFRAVFGGTHLARASEERIAFTLDAFARYDVRRIIPGHCTGAPAAKAFRERFGDRCAGSGAGFAYAF